MLNDKIEIVDFENFHVKLGSNYFPKTENFTDFPIRD